MSGGSLDYAYLRVQEVAEAVQERAQTELHVTFAAHLRKVSKALRALEWVLSDDSAPGDEIAAIRDVLHE